MLNIIKRVFAGTPKAAPAGASAFTFGDPTPVLDGRDILDYTEAYWQGQYYEPPVSLTGLAKTMRAAVHHASALYFKRNALVGSFKESKYLTREAFSRFALDFLWAGNAYLEPIYSRTGRLLSLKPAPAKYVRRGKDDQYWWLTTGSMAGQPFARPLVHILEPDINQELYGIPEYLAGLQSILLAEAATIFRRRYYVNGSHAGYVLYITDAMHDTKDVDALREALKAAKGPGNFRNLFVYAPGGKKDGLQILPVGEVAAADQFAKVKEATRDDMMAIHRIPPQLIGVVPTSGSAFGDAGTAAKIFATSEIAPLQQRLREVNTITGQQVIDFDPYRLDLT